MSNYTFLLDAVQTTDSKEPVSSERPEGNIVQKSDEILQEWVKKGFQPVPPPLPKKDVVPSGSPKKQK